MSKLLESGENYLETILILIQKGKGVRSIDIANKMNLSKSNRVFSFTIISSIDSRINFLKEGEGESKWLTIKEEIVLL